MGRCRYRGEQCWRLSSRAANRPAGRGVGPDLRGEPSGALSRLPRLRPTNGSPGDQGLNHHIGSGAARNMRAPTVHYCASKTALERITKGMALEFAPFGVRVNIVEPGPPGSEVSPLTDAHVSRVMSNIPLGRASGPSDAPGAIIYLCPRQLNLSPARCSASMAATPSARQRSTLTISAKGWTDGVKTEPEFPLRMARKATARQWFSSADVDVESPYQWANRGKTPQRLGELEQRRFSHGVAA